MKTDLLGTRSNSMKGAQIFENHRSVSWNKTNLVVHCHSCTPCLTSAHDKYLIVRILDPYLLAFNKFHNTSSSSMKDLNGRK